MSYTLVMRIGQSFTLLFALMLATPVCFAEEPAAAPDKAVALDAKVPDDFSERKIGTTGATVKTPADWKENKTHPDDHKLVLSGGEDRAIRFAIAPAKKITLEKLMKAMPDGLAKDMADFHLVKSDYVKIDGVPAGRIIYTYSQDGEQYEIFQLFVIKGGNRCIVSFGCKPASFEKALPTFESVAASLKIP